MKNLKHIISAFIDFIEILKKLRYYNMNNHH